MKFEFKIPNPATYQADNPTDVIITAEKGDDHTAILALFAATERPGVLNRMFNELVQEMIQEAIRKSDAKAAKAKAARKRKSA